MGRASNYAERTSHLLAIYVSTNKENREKRIKYWLCSGSSKHMSSSRLFRPGFGKLRSMGQILPPVLVNKVSLERSPHPRPGSFIYCWRQLVCFKSNCDKDHVAQSLKYLLSDLLQKKSASQGRPREVSACPLFLSASLTERRNCALGWVINFHYFLPFTHPLMLFLSQ